MIVSQFRTDCNGSANVDVEYTIRYIKVYDGKYEASFFDNLESENLSFVKYSESSKNADSAKQADKAVLADAASSLQNLAIVPLHTDQLNPQKWSFSKNSSVDASNKIILKATGDGNRVQFSLPNNIEVGKKYIMLFNIYNWKKIDNSQSWSLQFYNNGQGLSPNVAADGLHYYVFTANQVGSIQCLLQPVSANIALPVNMEILSFNTDFCACLPYTEELENKIKVWQQNYIPAPLYLVQTLNNVSKENKDITDSFNKINCLKDRVRQKANEPLITDYASVGNVSVYNVTNNPKDITIDIVGTKDLFFNYGVRIGEQLFTQEKKTFVYVVKGTFTGTNAKIVKLGVGGTGQTVLLAQDIEDNKPTTFEGVIEVVYNPNVTGNYQYLYLTQDKKDTALGQNLNYVLTECFVYEKVEGWNLQDYLNNVDKSLLIPEYLPENTATKDFVSTELETFKADVLNNNLTNGYKLTFDYDVAMSICYGQSLAVGGSGTDANTNFRNMLSFVGGCNEWASNLDIDNPTNVASFYGTDLVLLKDVTNKSHPPVASASIAWLSRLEKENNLKFDNFDYQFLMSTPGESGAPIGTFEKGTKTYRRLLLSVQKGKELSEKQGKTFGVPVLYWVQGEADMGTPFNTYYSKLKQLFVDLNTDIKAITGQTKDVQFITYQMSPFLDYNNKPIECSSPYVHLKLSLEESNVHMGGAMYQYEYGDALHPSDRAIIGHQLGIQAKRVVNDEKPLPVFYPKSHEVLELGGAWYLRVHFDVPCPPMRFDISGDKWHNKNGKQPNYGFELLKGETNIIASEPTIIRGTILQIKCSENPTGAMLRYAITGHYGGGNLCDSQNIIVNNKNTNYVLDNFAVAFREYVI